MIFTLVVVLPFTGPDTVRFTKEVRVGQVTNIVVLVGNRGAVLVWSDFIFTLVIFLPTIPITTSPIALGGRGRRGQLSC